MVIESVITIPIRGIVLFPGIISNFDASRKFSISAAKNALRTGSKVFCVTQINSNLDFVDSNDLYNTGVLADVLQIRRIGNDGLLNITLKPNVAAKRISTHKPDSRGYYYSDVEVFDEPEFSDDIMTSMPYMDSITNTVSEFVEFCGLNQSDIPSEILFPSTLEEQIYSVATTLFHDVESKQMILEEPDLFERAKLLILHIKKIIKSIDTERSIDEEVQSLLESNQEEMFLREKLNVIKSRLNSVDEENSDEIAKYTSKIKALGLDKEYTDELLKECEKLALMQITSPDANVIRNYLDEVLRIPWNKYTKDNLDLSKAKRVLNKEHYGLDKIKDRFLELIAVRKYTEKPGAQIICLVGPPGVGKTSIVSSVAKAMNKKYVRMSLGGIHDEAEIRGHRKTYIGAMPGRIANALKQAKSMNAVILMDEIDKLSNDYHGDPSSALLEVLDPAQNSTFRDNYIGIPLDLSDTVFVTTANDASRIPEPLFDRMEIIELSGYTFEEKLQIAKKHLIRKQRIAHGLTSAQMKLPDKTLRYIITYYTKEAGVRRLEQIIATLCRKSLIEIDETDASSVNITIERVKNWLGPEKFRDDEALKDDLVGVVNGLAWTAVGGEILQVEAITMPGNGKIEITGNIGDVMKESAKAAFSYIKANSGDYNIPDESFKSKDIHIHVPQGAVPKDGPSAGVTISTAVLSALTGRTFRHDVAMTGEISLTGRVMPIGGLKEKSMAAYKNGIKKVIIPKENVSDLYEVHQTVKNNVEFLPVSSLNEVFSIGLNP